MPGKKDRHNNNSHTDRERLRQTQLTPFERLDRMGIHVTVQFVPNFHQGGLSPTVAGIFRDPQIIGVIPEFAGLPRSLKQQLTQDLNDFSQGITQVMSPNWDMSSDPYLQQLTDAIGGSGKIIQNKMDRKCKK